MSGKHPRDDADAENDPSDDGDSDDEECKPPDMSAEEELAWLKRASNVLLQEVWKNVDTGKKRIEFYSRLKGAFPEASVDNMWPYKLPKCSSK